MKAAQLEEPQVDMLANAKEAIETQLAAAKKIEG